jgi:hypothetical protein
MNQPPKVAEAHDALTAERIAHGPTHGILFTQLRDIVARIDMHNAMSDAIGLPRQKIDETDLATIIATIREV